MKTIEINRRFNTEDKCLGYLELSRWPRFVQCIYCGEINISKITRQNKGKNRRTIIYQCLRKTCGKQFSPTSGTIFDSTHLPLTKWFMAIAMVCEAKKGISAKQLERHLGINYRTAWLLRYKFNEALRTTQNFYMQYSGPLTELLIGAHPTS